MKLLKPFVLLPIAALLSGCNAIVLDPSGYVALQQRDLLVISTGLMLLIIIPVMALTALFAWRYRQSNTEARYEPDWDHSTQLELVIWAAPLAIIICLGALTWAGTHLLDPYRPLNKIADDNILPENVQPLRVEAVALDWKWLFIYPEYGIATVNDLAAPVDRPIDFRITSSSVMNSFYVPALAGQIYAMPGMQTRLHAVINAPGEYTGFSANYSGAGFSGMHFAFHGTDEAGFQKWLADAKAAGGTLDRNAYLALERPSENEPVRRYAAVEPGLFDLILNLCVEPGKMCMHDMAAIDAKGGLGLAGINNTAPLTYDKYARRGAVFGSGQAYVTGICSVDPSSRPLVGAQLSTPVSTAPLLGAGLPRPRFMLPSRQSASELPLPLRPSNS